MAGALAQTSALPKKEYEQDFAIRQLQKDVEKISKEMEKQSTAIMEIRVDMVEMRAKLEAKLKEGLNENLWKTLVGTGILLSLFKYFS
ncbi:MAG: hypothetical protein J6M62_08215 [Selenomonadaceae bacterium]|nr:hypothetical protein [Selenomonadaceae bacterium]MBP3721664.1 hypothetical protein [Selenomonadaceae bacterium]